MRVFFDTEFLDDGRTIDLISIGLVREDGQQLYMVSSDFDRRRAEGDPWIRHNVLAHIPADYPSRPREDMKYSIEDFLYGEQPEFWAYYGAYDWVVLAQLWGRLLDLPASFPRYYRDIMVFAQEARAILPPRAGVAHHALGDAQWAKNAFEVVRQQIPPHLISAGLFSC